MTHTNVQEWFEAYDRAERERERGRGRAELARLGLVGVDDEMTREGGDCFVREVAACRWCRAAAGVEGWSLSKGVGPATRVRYLMGVMLITSLSPVLFCG